jgi:nicotinic acid phosphoribosyltransferase
MRHSVGTITRNNTYNAMRPENAKPVNASGATDANLRRQAQIDGKKLFEDWFQNKRKEIDTIFAQFNEDGISIAPLTATTFSDLYKWTMMPVIRKLEMAKKGPITVTFGIDLRDKDMRDAMKKDPELVTQIQAALKTLETRPFDRTVFDEVNKLKNNIIDDVTITAICGSNPAEVRTLVDANGVKPYNTVYKRTEADADKVTVCFYYRDDRTIEGDQPGVHFIEATGPWHKVTWLETSMMQCVYEAKLRYDLQKKGKQYKQWLYGALLRCAKSIAYTRLVQQKVSPPILPALFTGRRTGGFEFILLQNLFFAYCFKQYNPGSSAERIGYALGTSSVDSYVMLKSLELPCLNPSGTNAHELRMVTSVLYPTLDQNADKLPLTQVLVDYLYMTHVHNKTKGPMPMLPDTLGTRAYLKAAIHVTLDDEPFLNKITSARQDSGSLKDFLDNMTDFGYTGSKMASEIDTTETLLQAATMGYDTFGAGGFFGDSEKVWSIDPKAPSNSMAVKAMRVSYLGDAPADIPYIMQENGVVTGYPVKIGDPSDRNDPSFTKGKLSVDRNLELEQINKIKMHASDVRVAAGSSGGWSPGSTMEMGELLKMAGMSAQGGRRQRSTKSQAKRSTKKAAKKRTRHAKTRRV